METVHTLSLRKVKHSVGKYELIIDFEGYELKCPYYDMLMIHRAFEQNDVTAKMILVNKILEENDIIL